MKNKNIILFKWFILSRSLDLISTYVSKNGSLEYETNFLISKYHLGWLSLIIFNFFLIFLIFLILKWNNDKYYILAESKIKKDDISFTEYMSVLYYGKKINTKQFLLNAKVNYKIFINSFIQIVIFVLVITSIIIAINNILIGYDLVNLFSYKNIYYQKSLISFLNLIGFLFYGIFYHYKRFNNYKNA